MPGVDVTVEGFDELEDTLKSLIDERGEKILRKAMRAGGEVVQAAIIERAPVRTDQYRGNSKNPAWNLPPGAVKSDIKLHVTKADDGAIEAVIEPGKFTRPVCVWLEWGHRIVNGGRLTHWGKPGPGRVVGFVPAQPFIRPGLDESESSAIAAIEGTISSEIEKVMSRAKR